MDDDNANNRIISSDMIMMMIGWIISARMNSRMKMMMNEHANDK
jgi:hypothetical protein